MSATIALETPRRHSRVRNLVLGAAAAVVVAAGATAFVVNATDSTTTKAPTVSPAATPESHAHPAIQHGSADLTFFNGRR